MHRIIDWNELWKAIHASSPGKAEKDRDPAATWDKRAAAYHKVARGESEATRQELSLLDLRPGDTVLDMGAGTGRLAVPVARTASHVTALDASGGMLSILRKGMEEAGLTNYSCVRMRWEDVVVGRDIAPHDVVIGAFSLGFYDLQAALLKLDAAALRTVHLFWHAGEWRGEREMELYRAVFGEEGALKRGYPDYIYPLNILHDIGIYPHVRIYQAVWESAFDSVDEAARNWVTMHVHGQEDTSPVFEHFAKVLKKDGSGRFFERSVRPTAAVWWTKEARKK